MNSTLRNVAKVQIPIIKQSDSNRILPRYTHILERPNEDGIIMDELDSLQQDLEKLLSVCALRNRFFRSEIYSIDRVEEKRDKKGKPIEKSSLKRKGTDERYKDVKNSPARVMKKQYTPSNSFIGDTTLRNDIPKVTLPKNDTSDKFWASVEAYCADIQKEDIVFLDHLIQECSKETTMKIPEIGEHYAQEWTEEILAEEQNNARSPKSKAQLNDAKRNGINLLLETFSNLKTRGSLPALIEERVMTNFPTVIDKLKPSDLSLLKACISQKGGVCMDKRLKIEQGILTMDDLNRNPPEDEILTEIKRCQQELAAVNEYNIEELNKLRNIVLKDLKRQEVKQEINSIDNEILELYNNILQAKQKDDEDYVRIKKFEAEADNLLKQQNALNQELTQLTDMNVLY